MTSAILLVACVLLAGAVVALATALRRVAARLADLELGAGTRQARPAFEPDPAPGELADASGGGEESSGFVITRLGQDPVDEPSPTLEPRLFADLVLREAVVKAASFAYGLRRGLSPANRNRIRFEMRREVRRARKHRKAEQREAIRDWRARRRAGVQEESAA